MWTFPVLLDCRPAFLLRAQPGSLLLAPLGDGTVLSHLRARLDAVTTAPPVIVARFDVDAAYRAAIHDACPDAEIVEPLPAFAERLHTYEPSDRLLLADPTCLPLEARDGALARLREEADSRAVRHLVALEQHREGTREFVDADASGRVRAIQRYYDSATWPFTTGVAASLVPVACLRVSHEPPLGSLARLRRVLSSQGVPSRDFPLEGGAVSLSTEQGLLAMNERSVLAIARNLPARDGLRSSVHAGRNVRIHPSASLIGPVVLQDGAEIEEAATIIGPAVIGPGSRVGARATVAQSVVGANQEVRAGAELRHHVYLGDPERSAVGAGETDIQSAWQEPNTWETSPHPLSPETTRRRYYPAIKRAIDAVAAALGIVLLSPLGILVSILVKLESRGPVHFGHLREGLDGRPFRCWKFRTMVTGADVQQRRLARLNQVDGPQFKVKRDPRRTRVGRLLSLTNLDEIPQLWNVLLGEMSLVGPRPSPFRENQVCVPWREGRLSVRPGITGLWQICRHDRHKGDFHQWIYYDLLYVRNMSLWLDVKILALTPLSFLRSGAIPLSWLLSPATYGERRTASRQPDAQIDQHEALRLDAPEAAEPADTRLP
ncbi:MAG TPA: sugar transferase [Vicinamibacteria bacterium]|nr:sugar transferase [Vicinamibacteria bacterium]